MVQPTVQDTRQDNEGLAIALISVGHFLSHFYGLALPAMFLTLKEVFNVSYLELGLAMTAYNLLGGIAQAPVGFIVDRVGPHVVLVIGLGVNAAAIALMGLAETYPILLLLAVVAGLGNSVFHPTNYALLAGSVAEARLGRAFSIHTFAGFFGGACAPVIMLALAAAFDWRAAFIIVGILGLVATAMIAFSSNNLRGEEATEKRIAQTGSQGLRLITSPTIILFFLFFVFYGLAAGGLIAFTSSTLARLNGITAEWANLALTGHLFGVAAGVMISGLIVDRIERHDLVASAALVLAAAFVLLPLTMIGDGATLAVIMTMVGIGLGAVLPPRDLMVREATPLGQAGKVFGFVFVGYTVGASLSPLLFGWLLDIGHPALIFALSATFTILSLLAVIAGRRMM